MTSYGEVYDHPGEGQAIESTAAIAHVTKTLAGVVINYFNAGDSSLYLFNKTNGEFKLLAHTPTELFEQHGRTYISTTELLGAERSLQRISEQIGSMLLPKALEWAIVGISDGIQDEDAQGISTANLEEIMRYSAPSSMPREIIGAVEKYDDASVFVTSNISSILI